jgi:hypothetical protein
LQINRRKSLYALKYDDLQLSEYYKLVTKPPYTLPL